MARIMLCDDSRTILSLFEQKLSAAGHVVVGMGRDGEEGLKLYAELKPDLALLDVTMPNKDGRECLQGILALNPTAKVVMVSALKDERIVDNCIESGAKAFISKEKIYKDDSFKNEILPLLEQILKAA